MADQRDITVNFYGFWPGFNPAEFLAYNSYLRGRYSLELSDDPEFAICGTFADPRPVPPNATKVQFITENVAPGLDCYDWVTSFALMDPQHPRHMRLPLYATYLRRFHAGLNALVRNPDESPGLHRPGFSNFVFHNRKCQQRNDFFIKLSKYKRIDAPSRCMNNMPGFDETYNGIEPPKWHFLRKYKFTIAYENASSPGYTTEKIADAMAARSVPIYWGNPLVHLDFNPKSFLNRHDFDSDEAFIEHIIRVDQDDELYSKIFSEPYWHNNSIPEAINDSTCLAFWEKVFASRRVML